MPDISGNHLWEKTLMLNQSYTQVDPVQHQFPEMPAQIRSASQAYESAFQLARADDTLGWGRLVRQIRPNVFKFISGMETKGIRWKLA